MGTRHCTTSADCPSGQVCLDSVCTAPRDGGRADGSLPDATFVDAPRGDTPSTLTIDPPSPTIDTDGTPQTLQLHALLDGREVTGASWLVDDVVVGTISPGGLYTARGLVAGVSHVTARYGAYEATTDVTVTVHATQNPGGVAPDVQTMLRGGGAADGSFRWLYPYDATVFPRGLAAPVLQLAGGADATRVTIDIEESGFHYEGFFAASTPVQITLPTDVWNGATASAGAGQHVNVGVTKIAGGAVTGPAREHYLVAQGRLTGSIYYNSYNSHLAGGGAILRVRFGQDVELVQGGCAVCHSVSANGQRIATGLSWSGSATITGTGNPMQSGTVNIGAAGPPTAAWTDPDGRRYSFGALTPDGAWVLSNAVPPDNRIRGLSGAMTSQIWDAATGAMVPAPSFTSQVQYAVTPQFAPDGSALAFSWFQDPSVANGRVLTVMSFDGAMSPPVFGAPRRVYTADASHVAGWPSFLPDGHAVLFGEAQGFDTSTGAGAGRPNNPVYGDVHLVDLTSCDGSGESCAMSTLEALNGYSGGSFYLPYGEGEEAHSNFEPTVLPVAIGGYYWVVFTSRRAYGNTIAPGGTVPGGEDRWGTTDGAGGEHPSVRKKLWIAAIDMSGAPGSDRSHPAFYLSGQELESGNMRGFAALDPCRADGASCESAADCCGGFCRQTDTGADGTPILQCVPPPGGCSQELETCETSADCCDVTRGTQCINGRCAQPVLG
ncbi:MAG: hypothetical protein U0234_27900 [Sandaracinus sp.]